MSKFTESAASRETSPELMDAILEVGGDEAQAVRIWEDGPTHAELDALIEIVTKNGMYETTDFVWGEAGEHWESVFAEAQ